MKLSICTAVKFLFFQKISLLSSIVFVTYFFVKIFQLAFKQGLIFKASFQTFCQGSILAKQTFGTLYLYNVMTSDKHRYSKSQRIVSIYPLKKALYTLDACCKTCNCVYDLAAIKYVSSAE